jgi:hypothetical protein
VALRIRVTIKRDMLPALRHHRKAGSPALHHRVIRVVAAGSFHRRGRSQSTPPGQSARRHGKDPAMSAIAPPQMEHSSVSFSVQPLQDVGSPALRGNLYFT